MMPPSSKQPMSGLGKVTRDWSSATSSQGDPIPWTPSPPKEAPKKQLSGIEQRLKDIQEALKGNIVSSERVLASSTAQNRPGASQPFQRTASGSSLKRGADAAESAQPPVKKRQLPGSWTEPEPAKTAEYRSSANAGTARKIISATTKSKPAAVFLSQEQTHILRLVEQGQSVFYTGSAGTGKSVLLREIIKILKKKHARSTDAIAITASTGMAACNIGGITIHSFSGIGLGIESAQDLVKKIRKNKKSMSRWLRTKVLIIDEVSMVEADLFDKLAEIGSTLRKTPGPFGGLQLIVTGDFFQLPPVTKQGETRFAFEAEQWGQAIKNTFNLTKVFRQRDQQFVDMLNEMRFGTLSTKSIAKFRSLTRPIRYDDGIAATELFPRREEVDRANSTRMTSLQTETHTYRAFHGGSMQDDSQREKLLANFMAPKSIELRVGAQVMMIKNVDEVLVNGSLGVVTRFVDPALEKDLADPFGKDKEGGKKLTAAPVAAGGTVYPVVEFATPKGTMEVLVQPELWKVELPNGEVPVSRTQLPLILAWAMSIHKSQGQTLERVKVDLGKVFEKGQAYVALSRATSLEGLQVLNFDPNKVQAHPKVVQWSKTLKTIEEA